MPPNIAIRAAGLSKKYRSGGGELVVFEGLNLETLAAEGREVRRRHTKLPGENLR